MFFNNMIWTRMSEDARTKRWSRIIASLDRPRRGDCTSWRVDKIHIFIENVSTSMKSRYATILSVVGENTPDKNSFKFFKQHFYCFFKYPNWFLGSSFHVLDIIFNLKLLYVNFLFPTHSCLFRVVFTTIYTTSYFFL